MKKIISFIIILGTEIFAIGYTTSKEGQKYPIENLWKEIPDFLEESYKLNPSSRLKRIAIDGLHLGLLLK